MADATADLLQALISVVARGTFPEDVLREAVGASKQQQAYNLCDGRRRQSEIVKLLKLDAGNFSRTVTRWVELSLIFRLGEGSDTKLRHLYPLPKVEVRRLREGASASKKPRRRR